MVDVCQQSSKASGKVGRDSWHLQAREDCESASMTFLFYPEKMSWIRICSFSAAPSQSLSYILFTPGSYWVQPQYYAVGTERLHLEQLGIKHFPQEHLTGKIKEESAFSLLIPTFPVSPERFEAMTNFFFFFTSPFLFLSSVPAVTTHVFLG